MTNFFTVVMNKLWHGAWGKEHGANLAVMKDIFLTSSYDKLSLAEFSQAYFTMRHAPCTMQIAEIQFNQNPLK